MCQHSYPTQCFHKVQASPYLHGADDYLGSACSLSLTAIFVCCVAFKYAELTDLSEIQAKMCLLNSFSP